MVSRNSSASKDTPSKLGGYPAIFKFYEDGKSRRYNLLFAVNGGVLAIAKALPNQGDAFLSGLALRHVAMGMVVFTILMAIDIWVFGMRMRRAGDDSKAGAAEGIFSWWGRGVLATISLLMIAAWLSIVFPSEAP